LQLENFELSWKGPLMLKNLTKIEVIEVVLFQLQQCFLISEKKPSNSAWCLPTKNGNLTSLN